MTRVVGIILIGLGAFMLVMAPLLRLQVAPALVRAPADLHSKTTLYADDANYFHAKDLKLRTGERLTVTNTVRADAKASSFDTAVYDTFTVIEDVENAWTVEIQKQRLAFDRRTGQLKNCCGASVGDDTTVRQSGLGLYWPMDLKKQTYQLFDGTTGRTWPARFEGVQDVDGVSAYRFVQDIPQTKLNRPGTELPGRLLGATGKAGKKSVLADRYYTTRNTYFVDPRTGATVNLQREINTVLRAQDGSGELTVADFTLKMSDESRKALVAKSEDGAAQITKITVGLPVAIGIGGVVLLIAGTAITLVSGRRRP